MLALSRQKANMETVATNAFFIKVCFLKVPLTLSPAEVSVFQASTKTKWDTTPKHNILPVGRKSDTRLAYKYSCYRNLITAVCTVVF